MVLELTYGVDYCRICDLEPGDHFSIPGLSGHWAVSRIKRRRIEAYLVNKNKVRGQGSRNGFVHRFSMKSQEYVHLIT